MSTHNTSLPSPRFSMIVAHGEDLLVGIGEKLPWQLPEDLAHFKAYTHGRPVIMGRATYESILGYLGKPLPGRHTHVLTRDADYQTPFDNVSVVNSVEAMLASCPDKAVVCGGAAIYRLLLPYVDQVVATVVDGQYADQKTPNTVYLDDFRDGFVYDKERSACGLVSEKGITYHIEYWDRLTQGDSA